MSIVVAGFSNSNKVPGFYGETRFGQGRAAFGAASLKVLVCGLKTSSGTITANQDIVEVFTPEECDTYGGAGSELARGGRSAMQTKGVRIFLCSAAEAAGTAGTATITITGSWTVAGTLNLCIAGVQVEVILTTTESTVTLAAAKIKAAINANTQLPVTADNSSGVLTITSKQLSVRANQILVFQDTSLIPSGMTSTLAGGTALVANKLVPLTGGAGVETMTTMLTALHPGRYDRIAVAQNDATSLAAWEAQIDDKAGSQVGRLEHVVVGHIGSLAAATSLAQTTLNNQRFELKNLINGETPAFEMACTHAAQRASAEAVNPNQGYDGVKLLGVRGQRYSTDRPNLATKLAALDNGVSICTTTDSGDVVSVRAITTRSLNGSAPDYSTLDTAQAIVPDYTRDRLEFVWLNEFLVANKYVRDNPSENEKSVPAGVATPDLWTARVTKELFDMERELIISNVADNKPFSEFNTVAKRIQSAVPVFPLPIQHQIGVVVSQLQNAA